MAAFGLQRCEDLYKFTSVSEVCTACIIKALLYTTLQHRSQPSSYSPLWGPQIIVISFLHVLNVVGEIRQSWCAPVLIAADCPTDWLTDWPTNFKDDYTNHWITKHDPRTAGSHLVTSESLISFYQAKIWCWKLTYICTPVLSVKSVMINFLSITQPHQPDNRFLTCCLILFCRFLYWNCLVWVILISLPQKGMDCYIVT
jgi:hypothetical protein